MPVFEYKAIDRGGRSQKGFVDAENARAARLQLRDEGVFPTELREGADDAIPSDEGSRFEIRMPRLGVSLMDQAVATRQLSTLVGAGVPLISALGAISEQCENARLKAEFGRVRDRLNEGASLADAMANGDVFSDLYTSMVRAGETGGALEAILERLASYLESQVRLRNKVSAILVYPIFMLFFTLIIVGVLVTFVLPQITTLLDSLDQELPVYTRVIIGGSEWVRSYWWVLAIALLAGFAGFRAFVATERGRRSWDQTLLRLPVVGRVTRVVAVSRFARTLSTLLSGGIPIVQAMAVGRDVAGNVVLGDAIDKARESITEGASIAQPLRQSGQFPPMVTQMIEVGEQSGQLEAMLAKVAETYDEEVETTVSRLTALLEPVLILIMVGIVLLIIMATLQPVLKLTTSLS
ncbi:MAG: type II secretion system inner membrane protein GspF [Deltaproteobacteria bacterium]|nr:type II secretion system inner membrane protein GspF [Deltaproteobacteria bacterium]